jgi:hypothetical protein
MVVMRVTRVKQVTFPFLLATMTDAELVEFVADFREGILDGRPSDMMCFMVCAPLVTLLNMYGVKCEMVSGEDDERNHYWLKLADGRVLDPTADQFNGSQHRRLPPVYLGKPTAIHRRFSRAAS